LKFGSAVTSVSFFTRDLSPEALKAELSLEKRRRIEQLLAAPHIVRDPNLLGGSRNITPVGPGYYSFNWWLNRTDKSDKRLYVDATPDTL
jgi:hypothetical protein